MSTLESQILSRFESSATLDRSELTFDADYDSVGRALRRLVMDGRLTRVGRGRYREAVPGRNVLPINSIADAIDKRIQRSRRNVFLRCDFASHGSYDAVGRALRQKTKDGKLIQIGYGLYAKASTSPFTGKPVPIIGIKRLATEALNRLGAKVAPSSFDEAYNRDRSTQVPTGRALAVEGRIRRQIGYDGNYVVLECSRSRRNDRGRAAAAGSKL